MSWAGWAGRNRTHQRPGRGDAPSDEGADGEAAQERVGGRALQRQPQGRVAEGGDLAGGQVGGADGLMRERRHPARHAGRHRGGQV